MPTVTIYASSGTYGHDRHTYGPAAPLLATLALLDGRFGSRTVREIVLNHSGHKVTLDHAEYLHWYEVWKQMPPWAQADEADERGAWEEAAWLRLRHAYSGHYRPGISSPAGAVTEVNLDGITIHDADGRGWTWWADGRGWICHAASSRSGDDPPAEVEKIIQSLIVQSFAVVQS